MSTQPEALRLAEYHECAEDLHSIQTAAELRRLHALLEAEQALHQRVTYPELRRLHAQRDALLEALKVVIDDLMYQDHARVIDVARAAIKAVEEGK